MRILITGTNGYIGRNLKERFQEEGREIFCPKRQELDLVDGEAVYAYVSSGNFDVVIHCAVTLLSVEQNLKMYFNLEKCSSSFGKMICIGSGAEYGMKHYLSGMKEGYFGTHIPQDIYGFSKYVIAKDIESRYRNIYNLRVFGIYGKYEDYKRRFISNNICRALCGLNLSIRKNMFFDYLYIDDFVRIVEIFMERVPVKRSYNICTGKPVDLLGLAEIIRRVDGKDLPIDIKEEGLNPEYSGDNSLFLGEFGNFDFTGHEEAVRKLYGWYKNSSGIPFRAEDFS